MTIIIAPSITKRKAMNVMMEKLTEIGVDEIRPVLFSRTDEKYYPPMLKRWKRIARQSLKINKRLYETEIYPPTPFKKFIECTRIARTKLWLHIDGETMLPQNPNLLIISVIGPPGDFIDEEKELLIDNGFIQFKINDCIVKSETAAISISAILKNRYTND